MLVNILIVTNCILNLFFALILGIVSFSSIKRIKETKKQVKQVQVKK